jgi:hypothetical protein
MPIIRTILSADKSDPAARHLLTAIQYLVPQMHDSLTCTIEHRDPRGGSFSLAEAFEHVRREVALISVETDVLNGYGSFFYPIDMSIRARPKSRAYPVNGMVVAIARQGQTLGIYLQTISCGEIHADARTLLQNMVGLLQSRLIRHPSSPEDDAVQAALLRAIAEAHEAVEPRTFQ